MEAEGSADPAKGRYFSQFYPLPTLIPVHLWSILISSAHLCLDLRSTLFPTRTVFHTHFILLDLISLIIFSDIHKLRSTSLCKSHHPPVNSSLLGLNILSGLFVKLPQSKLFLWGIRKFDSHRLTGKTIVIYILIFRSL
jgi:hypothetical protein